MTPEAKVKVMLKRRLEDIFGDDAYRFCPVQNGMGAPALDVYYCIRGWFVAFETKAPGKKPTLRQQETIDQIKRAGGFAFVVDGEDSLHEALLVIRAAVR